MAGGTAVPLALCLTAWLSLCRGEDVVSLAGAPDAVLDSLEILEGKLDRIVVDSYGVRHQVASTLSRIEVLENDKIQGHKPETCYERSKPQDMQAKASKINFVEVGPDLGVIMTHRTQKPVRPHCQFPVLLEDSRGNGSTRLEGEFCLPEYSSGGVAAADFNKDGLVDLFFTNAEGPSILYKNTGGKFEDVSASLGVGPAKFGSGAVWTDIDADGDLDLYVTSVGNQRHYLYINDHGVFHEEAVARNLDLARLNGRKLSGMTPNAGDYDRDGYPDIYVSEWSMLNPKLVSASQLMHNQGKSRPGYFTDVTAPLNIQIRIPESFCSSFTDLDNDGWSELIVTADAGASEIFWNNRNGTFTKCTEECGLTVPADAMGQAMGDFDMDGNMDWWLTAIHHGNTSVSCEVFGCSFSTIGNLLLRNAGNRKLVDYTDTVGVREGFWGWGNALIDFNNDRFLDFMMTNGHDDPSTAIDDALSTTPAQLWESLGPNFNFSTVERSKFYGLNHTLEGRGLVKVDFDDDGDEDVIIVNYVGPPTVLRNDGGNQNFWLKIEVKNPCASDPAMLCFSLGARVHVKSADGMTQLQEIGSGSQYMAQNELKAHFGLGKLTSNVEVRVIWPALGKEMNISEVPPNSRLRVVPPTTSSFINLTYSSMAQCPELTIASVSQPGDGVNITINPDNQTLSMKLPVLADNKPYIAPSGAISFNYTLQMTPAASSGTHLLSTGIVKILTLENSVSDSLRKACATSQFTPPGMTIPTGRSMDGVGNNVKNPLWGAKIGNLRREVSATYANGISTPSGVCDGNKRFQYAACPFPNENALDGSFRPSPRNVSNVVFQQITNVYSKRGLSDLHSHFGQFVAHDTDFSSPLARIEVQEIRHDVWFPISVPKGDVHFDPYREGNKALPFVRTAYSTCTGANFLRVREQFNRISSYIDGTNVYGDADRLKHLRSFSKGKMILDTINGETFIPKNRFGIVNDNPVGRVRRELLTAGDTRANVQPALIVLHTLFVREHNRLCDVYLTANPGASDQEVFSYAYKIVVAELQAIIFREYLPALIGRNMSAYTGYDPTVDPSVSNLFATVAFRFGHSQVNTHLWRFDVNGSVPHVGHVPLRDGYFAPERVLNEGGIDPYLRGFVEQRAQEIDTLMVDDMRNVLFPAGRRGGLDLTAFNIQRGRDHGIPDYNTARKGVKLRFHQDIAEITKNSRVVAQLKSLYPNVDVIDPWVGGLAEDHVNGSELGAFFEKVVIDNFEAIRTGDRFWYERYLNQSEIDMVHSLTLSQIVKLNTGVKTYPDNPFFSSRYCTDVADHQCVPVDQPTCPKSSTVTSPPTMAATSLTTSNPPATSTGTSPAMFMASNPLTTNTSSSTVPLTSPAASSTITAVSPCCAANVQCTANLTTTSEKLRHVSALANSAQMALVRCTANNSNITDSLNYCNRLVQATSVVGRNQTQLIATLRQLVNSLQGNLTLIKAQFHQTASSLTVALHNTTMLHKAFEILAKAIGKHDFNATYILEFFRLQTPALLSSVVLPIRTLQYVYANRTKCLLELHEEKNTTSLLQKSYNSTLLSYHNYQRKKEMEISSALSNCAVNVTTIVQKYSALLVEAEANCSVRLNASRKAIAECSHINASSSLLPTLVATVKQLGDCRSRAQAVSSNLTVCLNDVRIGKADTADCRQKLNTSNASLALSQATYMTVRNEVRRVSALVTTLLNRLDNNSRILSSAMNTTSDLNNSLASCSSRNTALVTDVSMYKALLVDARKNLTAVQSLLRESDAATTSLMQEPTTFPLTTQASTTTSNTDLRRLRLRVRELEEKEVMFEKNISWHHKTLENVTYMYGYVREQNDDLKVQLSQIACPHVWPVIAGSYEGKILIGLAAGFCLLSLILIACMCRRRTNKHVNRSTDAFQNLTKDVIFGHRKYSTTEKPVLNGETLEMDTLHY